MKNTIRSHGWVGSHWVAWHHGIPEAVEEFVESGIRRFHDLFLSGVPIAVEWSDAGGSNSTFAIDCVGEAGVYAQILTVGERWWSTTLEQREHDLVMTLLISECMREGILSLGESQQELRLKIDEDSYIEGEDAVLELNVMAAELAAAR